MNMDEEMKNIEGIESVLDKVPEDEEEQTTFDVDNDFFKAAQEDESIEILDVEETE